MPSERPRLSKSAESRTLSIPVVLSERSADSIRIVTLSIATDGTVQDLHQSISSLLGPNHILGKLLFRGSEPDHGSPLRDFASATSTEPRFRLSYQKPIEVEVTTPNGQKLVLSLR